MHADAGNAVDDAYGGRDAAMGANDGLEVGSECDVFGKGKA